MQLKEMQIQTLTETSVHIHYFGKLHKTVKLQISPKT